MSNGLRGLRSRVWVGIEGSERAEILVTPIGVNAYETAVDQVGRRDPSSMKALDGSLDRFRGAFDELFLVGNLGPLGDGVGA